MGQDTGTCIVISVSKMVLELLGDLKIQYQETYVSESERTILGDLYNIGDLP